MADSSGAVTNGTSGRTASPAPTTQVTQNTARSSTPSASQQQPVQPSSTTHQQGQGAIKYYTTEATGPNTSYTDTGTSTRPRDARTIHMVLAAAGVTAYQERVPLQLLDFAYRYTSSILSDAQHLLAEGYVGSASGGGGSRAAQAAAAAAAAKDGEIPLAALKLATSSRQGFSFAESFPKETLLQLAAEKNKTKLPDVSKEIQFGVRLPHERYVMTGTSWNLAEEWDSEGDEENDQLDETRGVASLTAAPVTSTSQRKEDEDEEMADGEDDDEDQNGFEQVFGADNDGADDDKKMQDG